MAHYVAISKASFAAGLLRPNPTSVSREDIAHFHALLDGVIVECSPANVQKCREWLLETTTPSSARISALGKYLIALSASFTESQRVTSSDGSGKATPSNRKRLHILYLLNDLLHHTKYHLGTLHVHTSLTSNLQPHLVELVGLAASFELSKNGKLHRRIGEVLDTWEDNGYYTTHYVNKLRETAENAGKSDVSARDALKLRELGNHPETVGKASGKEAPFVMPATHGDASTPYYDLPAGNLMPHIVPNSSTPINSSLVKPLQFMAGPADERIATAVRDFLKDVEAISGTSYNFQEDGVTDIDELGQPMIKDEATSELLGGDGYYGWSRAFCEKMTKRSKEESFPSMRGFQGDGRQRKRLSGDESPRSRRKYSSSTRGSGDSRSRSRSALRSPFKPRFESERHSRHRSRSTSYSRSPPRGLRSLRSRSRSRPRSRSPNGEPPARQVPPTRSVPLDERRAPAPVFPQMPAPGPSATPPPPPPSFAALFPQGFPLGPGGVPIPPPPPPNHRGPWPPAPAPMMPIASFNQQFGQFPMFSNFPVPPPPPFGMAPYQMSGPSPPAPGRAGFQAHDGSPLPQQGHLGLGNASVQSDTFAGSGPGARNGWQQSKTLRQPGGGRGQ